MLQTKLDLHKIISGYSNICEAGNFWVFSQKKHQGEVHKISLKTVCISYPILKELEARGPTTEMSSAKHTASLMYQSSRYITS